jgi:hypothetical protein
MSGKMMSSKTYRVSTRARESRRIREPEGLDGSARGSKPKKTDEESVKSTLVIDQTRWQRPANAAAGQMLHKMQKRQAI